jgi:hypothetical protein
MSESETNYSNPDGSYSSPEANQLEPEVKSPEPEAIPSDPEVKISEREPANFEPNVSYPEPEANSNPAPEINNSDPAPEATGDFVPEVTDAEAQNISEAETQTSELEAKKNISTDDRIRIKDIAVLANVSAGTVDRVIHNRGGVAPESKKRIEEILNRLNFKPNKMARVLAIKKDHKLVVLLPEAVPGDYWWDIITGIRRAEEEV